MNKKKTFPKVSRLEKSVRMNSRHDTYAINGFCSLCSLSKVRATIFERLCIRWVGPGDHDEQ